MTKPQRGIQSIDVGGRLLLALSRSAGAMMLKELAEAAEMSPAKAHAYLVSFCKLGLMEQDATTGRYDLGPFALELGLTSLNRLDPVRIASAEIGALAERIGHSIAIAVWGNFGPTIIRFEQSVRPIHVNMRTGTVMSMVETATGVLLAAYKSPVVINLALAATHPERASQAEARRRVDAMNDVYADVRQRGLARVQGSPIPGINAISAPVFDHSGDVALAITALGPASEFDARWSGPIAAELRDAAARLSTRLVADSRPRLNHGQETQRK